jgi:hypothetical protein
MRPAAHRLHQRGELRSALASARRGHVGERRDNLEIGPLGIGRKRVALQVEPLLQGRDAHVERGMPVLRSGDVSSKVFLS